MSRRESAVMRSIGDEMASATTLEKLDEGRQALMIATGRLRVKLESPRADTDARPAPEAPTR